MKLNPVFKLEEEEEASKQTTVIRSSKDSRSKTVFQMKPFKRKQQHPTATLSTSCLALKLLLLQLLLRHPLALLISSISVQQIVVAQDLPELRQLQDVARRQQQQHSSGHRQPQNGANLSPVLAHKTGNKMIKTFSEFLAELPTLSVGQKHSARFECELDEELHSSKLIWLKLSRLHEPPNSAINSSSDSNSNATSSQQLNHDDVKLISLNEKLIAPDKRFKVRRQSALKWTLTIDNVGALDNQAYYLCQISASEQDKRVNQTTDKSVSRFAGGAKLNVLTPPKIVEQETSDSFVQVDEFEPLVLRCKVIGEPQSQLMWKREDGKSLDGLEQRFRHEIKRNTQTNQIVSIDSSELIINSMGRNQSGAYLCIASNGVQPGVSQRVQVGLLNCRRFDAGGPSKQAARLEPCELGAHLAGSADDDSWLANERAATSWRASGGRVPTATAAAAAADKQQQQRRQQRPTPNDKRRTPMVKGQARVIATNINNTGGGRPAEEVSIKPASSSLDDADSSLSAAANNQPKPATEIPYLLCCWLVFLVASRSALSIGPS